MPLKAGWRRVPSSVHSVQLTSQTSSGSHQTGQPRLRAPGLTDFEGAVGSQAPLQLAGEQVDLGLLQPRPDPAGEDQPLPLSPAELGRARS